MAWEIHRSIKYHRFDLYRITCFKLLAIFRCHYQRPAILLLQISNSNSSSVIKYQRHISALRSEDIIGARHHCLWLSRFRVQPSLLGASAETISLSLSLRSNGRPHLRLSSRYTSRDSPNDPPMTSAHCTT